MNHGAAAQTRAATDRGATRAGPSHLRVAGLHVIRVRGSFYEMGHQHGAMLREEVPRGPLPYYRTYVERLMGEAHLGALSPLMWPALQRIVGSRVARGMPEFAMETLRGLADGAGLPFDAILEGATMPDTLVWLAAKLQKMAGVPPAVRHRVALGLGCTSAIAWGDATRDGKLLHARNTDYHGVGCWPRTATVVFSEPQQGHRYVSVTAAGLPLGGFTAMNEAGLSLVVHQHMFTDRARLGGMPIGLVGDIVMREASTLDEAEAILRRHRPIGCWTYLVADGRSRQVLCWEENPERQVSLRTGDDASTFPYANIYLDPDLGATETAFYGSYWRHNERRYARADALMREGHGALDPQSMARILGDTGDDGCRLSGSIAMLLTVASVVFRPEDGVLWVASGETPTSHGTFIPFDLATEAHAPQRGTLTGADGDSNAATAFECFRRAYLAHVDDGDPAEARRLVARACELDASQAVYHALSGLLSLRAGEPGSAGEALDRALSTGHRDPERIASFHLWRARAADIGGDRATALRHYRRSLGYDADPPVHRAAGRGLRRPFSRGRARRISVDFTFADVPAP